MLTSISRGTEHQTQGSHYAKELDHMSLFLLFSSVKKGNTYMAQVDLELTVLGWGLIGGKACLIQILSTHYEFVVSSQLRFTL